METELISSQLAVAYASASLLQWLKQQPWFPFMQLDSAKINRAFAVAVAFFTAIGIHWVSDFEATGGILTITISGLTGANIIHGLLAWVQQYGMQQASYKLLVKS